MAKRQLMRKAAGVVVACGVALALVVAFLSPGVATADLHLNDGGVWVTNAQRKLVGHLNYRARTLDSALLSDSSSFDVFQDGEQVFFSSNDANLLSSINVATTSLETSVPFPGMSTQVVGDSVAITDAANGKVWVQDVSQLAPFSPEESPALIEGVPQPQVAVGEEGSVHAVSADNKKLVSWYPDDKEPSTQTRELPDLGPDASLQIASVGEQPVVLDIASGTLYLPDESTRRLEGSELQLQESGPDSQSVIIATADTLLQVPLNGGDIVSSAPQQVKGAPSRPARHMGCAYGAWSGSGGFTRDCPDDSQDTLSIADNLDTAEKAIFRINRDVIVLNDALTGSLWLPNENMVLVENWDEVNSEIESDEESNENSVEENQDVLLPEPSAENRPPTAVDDELGVRAGRNNILPVIQNDSDPDGDFLTAIPITQPTIGTVTSARDGAALQLHIDKGVTGTSFFQYEISDGRGGTSQATAQVTVYGEEVNQPPTQLVVPSVSLSARRTATVNALVNWYDPESDPFYLESVSAPQGLSVRMREGGSVEVTEAGHGIGTSNVDIRVSDGRDIGEGAISVNVKDDTNIPPVANTDHLVIRQGTAASVSPLANDTDANGDPLRLIQILPSSDGISATIDSVAGTISVSGNIPGTYYLGYVVSDGPTTANGFVRVDVIDVSTEAPPTAEDDLGVLPAGGQTLVDLVANDSDPNGGVLTVQELDIPQGSPLVIALVNHQMVRISAPAGINEPQTFGYTVSNGVSSASATVTVIPRPALKGSEPPILSDDRLVVRSGDIASVPVLDNDRSPSNLKLAVVGELQHEIPDDLASVFISDDVIRVRGGSRGGSGTIVYTAQDSLGNIDSATVHVTVIPTDDESNTAPKPRDVTARTVAGKEVSIPIPLDGIDSEGDSVTLLGLGKAPSLGVANLEGSIFKYTPSKGATATDTFTYVVEDRYGKQASGQIRVGIAPEATSNQNPVALPDIVRIRPGVRVSVAVLANDIDPDGDSIQLVEDTVTSSSQGLGLESKRGRVIVTAPNHKGQHSVTYGIADGAGGQAEGLLTVVVSPDAPFLPPKARDDDVTTEEVRASTDETVLVSVLDNDEDPDGDIAEVKITSPDEGVSAEDDGRIRIKLKETPQILIYTITDINDLSASAVVRVPGKNVTRPSADPRTLPIRLDSGESTDIAINNHIVAREGHQVRITSPNKVSAGVGLDNSLLVKNATTLTVKPLPDFSGSTSVSLEVTDGTDASDTSGYTAVLTLPIEVAPSENRPPVMRATPMTIAPGEPAVAVDLATMVTDPDSDNPEEMAYSLDSVPDGITATLSGRTLAVSAPAGTSATGAVGALKVSVDDNNGGTATADIPVTVSASTRPLIQLSPANITLDAGGTATIDISDYATNPFADVGPITLVGQPSASEGGKATTNGTEITVSANPNFNGSFTVTYRVGDASNDPARQVVGAIEVVVRDRPGAPTGLTASVAGPGSVFLSWAAGPSHGSPITQFTVTDHVQGDTIDCGVVTSCLISNRTNGVEHRFSVTATNEIGESDPSAQVNTSVNIVPETPSAPSLSVGDGSITVNWTQPNNEGSPIISYKVTISPGETRTIPAGELSTTFAGLGNGTQYAVTVRAVNSEGESGVSASSQATPYGRPGAPGSLTISQIDTGEDGLETGTFVIQWTASSPNGRAIEYYTVEGGGIKRKVMAAGSLSTTIYDVPFTGGTSTFTVTATNDANDPGEHTSNPASVEASLVGRPLPPTISSVKATGENHQVKMDWGTSPGGGGWTPDQLRYEWSIGGDWMPLNGGTTTTLDSPVLQNGTSVAIRIRALAGSGDSLSISRVTQSDAVTPYGPPIAPTMSCEAGSDKVTCSWSGGSGNGRTPRYVLSDAVNKQVTTPGRETIAADPGDKVRLCITTVVPAEGVDDTSINCDEATIPHEGDGDVDLWMEGLNGKVKFDDFSKPDHYRLYCWNARSHAETDMGGGHHNVGNYLGQAYANGTASPFLPENGTVSFSCSGNPNDPSMRPNGDFSLEAVNTRTDEILWFR